MEDIYLRKSLPQLFAAAHLTREQSHRDVLHPSFQMYDNFFFMPSLQSCTPPSVPRCLARRFQRNFQSVRHSNAKTRAKHLVCKFNLQSITKNLRKYPRLPDLNCIIAPRLQTNRTNSRHLLKSPAVRVEFQLFFYLSHSQV